MYENVKSEYREFDHNSTYMAEKSRDGITVAHNCHGKNGMVFKKLKHVTVSILQFGPQSRNVTVSG